MKRRNDRFGMKGVARLLLAFLCASVAGRAFAVDLISNLIRCAPGMTPYVVLNGEERTSGKFYGYVNGGSGPGDTAFKDAKAWADEHHTPLVVVFDNGSGNTFTADLNDDEDYQGGRYLLQWMNSKAGPDNYNCMFTYFKGGTTGPAACKDAYDFCKQYGAGTLFPLVVCYWKWHDGTIKTSVTSGLSSVGSFKGPVDSFIAKNKPPPYTPPKCSVDFAVKDGELRATPDTKQVYVPMVRTNTTDAVGSKYGIEVTYPDATTANITFTADTVGEIKLEKVATAGKWADGKSIQLVLFNTNQVAVATNHITCVATPANSANFPSITGAGWGEWTLDYAAATGMAFEANAYLQPDTNELGSVAFETPLDWSTSNRYDTVYTNDITVFAKDVVAFDHEFAFAVSNVNTVVYTNDLQLFTKLGEFEDSENEATVEAVVTNTTTTRYVASLSFLNNETNVVPVEISVEATNTVYRVMPDDGGDVGTTTNKWSEMAFTATSVAAATNIVQYAIAGSEHGEGEETVETNLVNVSVSAVGTNYYYRGIVESPAQADIERKYPSGDFVTNCVYAVATSDSDVVTNEYKNLEGTWQPVSLEFAAAAKEFTTYMLTERLDAEIPEPASSDSGEGVTDATFKVSDTTTYYFVESNDFTTASADFSFAASNSVSYVFNGGATTNIDENAYVLVATNLSTVTTNFVSVRLADKDHAAGIVTEYGDYEDRQFTVAYTDSYYSVETNSYQYGISGDSDEPSKAFTLVVHGGIVWDNALIALNDGVFAKSRFADWCESNQIALVYLDLPEPGTGASLFSYSVASNGNSGASFMSVNGLSVEQGAALSAQSAADAEALFGGRGATALPVIALVRPDGSVCGHLRPQYNADGTCDAAENIARLDELVANAADLDEMANDDPAGAAGLVAAGTRDACPYPDDAGDGVIASGTLTVNDAIDCFQLAGDGWSGKKVVFALATEGEVPDLAWPEVAVLRYDATSDECVELDGELSVFITNGVRDAEIVYTFSQKDIDAGCIFVAATAYGDDDATATKFGRKSTFGYSISAYEATPNAGIISFDEQPENGIIQETTNQVFNVPLFRLFGSDGDVSVTVAIDETLTTATGRYEFVSTDLVWTNGETGVKYVPITLKGSEYNDGRYDITLRIKEIEAMAGVEKYFTTYTISYGKEPTDEGQIAVVSVTPAARADGRIYVRYVANGELHADDTISVQVNRTGGKGPAAAHISWKNGKDTVRETLSWANYLTGTQTAFLDDDFPEPGKSGYADVTVTVTSSNSVPMVKEGATLKVRVMPSDAPFFDDEAVTWSGVQYTTTETNLTALTVPVGMTVKSLAKISGTIPKGLKVAFVDGQLVVTGTPTDGTLSSTAVYWVTLTRDEGGTLYSMPVTVTFENQSLEDVNPGFTSARSWTGLPLTGAGRLMGLLDLTVSKNGKTSARYRMADGKTVAFSAPGLAGVDADGNVSLRAEKSVKSGGIVTTNELSAVLGADGSLEASVTCDGGNAVVVSLPAGAVSWSKDNTAERFGGNYVAAFPLADAVPAHSNTLCFGATSMRLKCNTASAWKAGKVTFAGTLPNGKAVSGTATLVPTTNNATSASLPVFASSSADTFSAMLDLDGARLAATEGIVPFWRHEESGIESLSYENDVSAIGTVWSWADWLECFGGKFDAKTAFGLPFNLNRTSGIAAGTMRLDVGGAGRQSTLSWKGVALPDAKPSIRGAYWYNVSKPYTDAKGNDRKRTVKAGDAVGLTIE